MYPRVMCITRALCSRLHYTSKISNLQFDEDPCEIKKYIKARLENPEKIDTKQICELSRQDFTITTYASLHESQPAIASV